MSSIQLCLQECISLAWLPHAMKQAPSMKPAAKLASVCRPPTGAAYALAPQPLFYSAAAAKTLMHSTGAAYGRLAKPLLLVSDLDDTLIGSTPVADASTAAFKAVWDRSRAAGVNCTLAINTGRTLPLWEDAFNSKRSVLPQPDVLVAGVGTRCYFYSHDAGTWSEDKAWTARMSEGWDNEGARRVMDDLITTYGHDNVEFRPDVEMHCHKLTVLYRKNLRAELMPHLHSSLQQAGLVATVIEGGAGRGPEWRFIDVLPAAAGKGSAMRYVQQVLGYDDSSTVAAGDANNDLLMLQQAPQAVLVGNAVPELKDWARQLKQQQQQGRGTDGCPAAAGKQQVVYLAEGHVAAGVLEGLQALGMMDNQLPN